MQDHLLQKAFEAYQADLEQITSAEKRLFGWVHELKCGKRKPDPSARKAELKTISAQVDKLESGAADAEQRFHARVDSANEFLVTKLKGLLACPHRFGQENSSAGARLLLDECKDFERAKGTFADRNALFASVCKIAESLADSLAPNTVATGQRVGQAQLAIYEQFMAITNPEEKAGFYRENRATILSVEALKTGHENVH